MKKLFIILSVMCLMSGVAMGQTAKYRGDVELNAGLMAGPDYLLDVTSSHGILFNKHLFVGLGTGLGVRSIFDEYASCVYIPFFLDVNYTFDKFSGIRPFIGGRAGTSIIAFDMMKKQSSVYAGLQFRNKMFFQIRTSWQPFDIDDYEDPYSGSQSFDVGFGYRF